MSGSITWNCCAAPACWSTCRSAKPSGWSGIDRRARGGRRRLAGLGIAGPVIGISPGAAYGNAKRWLPERFAEAGAASSRDAASLRPAFRLARRSGRLCEAVAAPLRAAGAAVRNLAGETTLREFIDLAAACRLFLTNDSGAMHVASALAVPTVAVFGATDDTTTGPTGPLARVVRGARRVQPLPAARMPHRPPLHDARYAPRAWPKWRSNCGRNPPPDGHTHQNPEPGAPRALRVPRLVVATGLFRCAAGRARTRTDSHPAAHRRRRAAGRGAAVGQECFPSCARAELAAALRVIDYVVAPIMAIWSAGRRADPLDMVRLEAADARRSTRTDRTCPRAGTPSELRRILAVRLGAMGDIVHTLPAVAALKRSACGLARHLGGGTAVGGAARRESIRGPRAAAAPRLRLRGCSKAGGSCAPSATTLRWIFKAC